MMNNQTFFTDSFFAMGTRCDIVFITSQQEHAQKVFHFVQNEIKNLEFRMSRFIPDSPISELNKSGKNKWIQVPGELWDILTLCYDFYMISNGAFDITASPLIQLWKNDNIPSEKEIKKAREISGFDKVEFDFENRRIRFLADKVEFDLGAIGKGIALDAVKPMIVNQGIKNGIVSFGESSILALGNHPNGEKWPLGIRNSFDLNEYIHVFAASNETITTSGIILNSDSGEVLRRNHIISPATGYPVKERKNVSVKSESATMGEFLSTTLLILPTGDQDIILNKMKNMEILELEYLEENEYKSKLTLI